MAYVFRLPADVTALVNKLDGTLCQTLAARGGTPSARVVKAWLTRLPPGLDDFIARFLAAKGVPQDRWLRIWPGFGDGLGSTPWLPSLIEAFHDHSFGWCWASPNSTLSLWDETGMVSLEEEVLCDFLREREGPYQPKVIWIDAVRDKRLRDMWFQCEACGE